MKLLKKGAEADIYQTMWNDSKAILKIRKTKTYRNSILDSKIRKQRTIKESQILSHVKSFGVPSPLVYFVNLKKTSITMQEIPGKPIHDLLDSQIIKLSREIGKLVGKLHKNGIMHGDLTTSNFILFRNIVYVIDHLNQQHKETNDHLLLDLIYVQNHLIYYVIVYVYLNIPFHHPM